MSTETLEGAELLVSRRPPLQRMWRGGLQGSEYTWAIAFTVPYIVLFLAFVAYPVAYGAWLGHEPSLYVELADDPIFQRTIVNTILYVGIGVNLKMFGALLLSGFFMRRGWWVKAPAARVRAAVGAAGAAGVHLDPLDAQRRVGSAQQLPV